MLVETVAGYGLATRHQHVIDLVSASEANLKVLAGKGRLVLVALPRAPSKLNLATMMSKRLTIAGTVLRSRSAEDKPLVSPSKWCPAGRGRLQ